MHNGTIPGGNQTHCPGGPCGIGLIRQEQELEWRYISPSPILKPGEKLGQFRVGEDRVLMTDHGPTKITVGDLACAILDEIEQPRHIRKRFTVGY